LLLSRLISPALDAQTTRVLSAVPHYLYIPIKQKYNELPILLWKTHKTGCRLRMG